MRAFAVALFGIGVGLAGGASAAPAPQDAQNWVAAVDRSDYAKSWAQAGALFQSHITAPDWAKQVAAVRQPLGAVVSRKFKVEQTADHLPGAPDGRYDVVQFDTVFANRTDAVETIVMAEEPTGWKVDGYFIR